MNYERKSLEFFAKVGHLVSGQEKESRSKDLVICDFSWYMRADYRNAHINVYIGCCKIPDNCTIYANIDLSSLQKTSSTFHRFDSQTKEVLIYRFIPPKIRRSSYPIRGVKISANITVESVVRPEIFTTQDDLSDIIFTIGEVRLNLHKIILARASPVFKAMLFGEFSESSSTEIVLPDKKVDLYVDFLSTIYPPFAEINAIRARYLLPLYMEYQMTEMASKCEHSLCTSAIYSKSVILPLTETDVEEIFDHLVLANMFSLEVLRDLAVSALGQVGSKSWEGSDVFASLSDDLRCLVYSARVRDLEEQLDDLQSCSEQNSVIVTESNEPVDNDG